MRLLIWTVTALLCSVLANGERAKDVGQVKVMTWNILAPLWVDKNYFEELGTVDMNLLNEDTRLRLVIKRIMDSDPDIINLQEVQEDTFEIIREALAPRYSAVPFAPNEETYWNDVRWIPEGNIYVKNGVATFYRKVKFFIDSHQLIPTSNNGSIALISVFRPVKRLFTKSKWGRGDPIIMVNSHLESGFFAQDAMARVQMGTKIHMAIEKTLDELKGKNPTVVWCGDFNTFGPHPGIQNIRNLGYQEEVTNNIPYTIVYPTTIPLFGNLTGLPIDYIFVKESHVKDGRIKFLSAEVPDLHAEEFSEENHRQTLLKIVREKMAKEKVRSASNIIKYLLTSKMFAGLFRSETDSEDYDSLFNRALRLGSDHQPLTVTLEMTI